jgi:C1A family cysteine protease
MKNFRLIFLSVYAIIIFLSSSVFAQSGYTFTEVKRLPATSVKDQYKTNTCWSFSSFSFFESELLRMGKEEFDLSEMFAVRACYGEKAKNSFV